MNKEEIENRIIVCEMRANDYREVGNTKTADRYDNEKHKWEKLLSDLELLDKRKVKELLDYRKGYFDLQQKNQELKEDISFCLHSIKQEMEMSTDSRTRGEMSSCYEILKRLNK